MWEKFKGKKAQKLDQLSLINSELQQKTGELQKENRKINSILTGIIGYQSEVFTGETTANELGLPKNIVIMFDYLRVRSWEFLLKNHIAGLIANKRVNWTIGSGLLFNAKPSEKPFIKYYGAIEGKKKHTEFIEQIEYQYRAYSKTVDVDHEKQRNLHEIARITDYNSFGDGDCLVLQRVAAGFPSLQIISGQCVVNPSITDQEIPKGNKICEGVEFDKNGEVVAYHVELETNNANGVYTPNPDDNLSYGTKRVLAYFKGTKIRQAWLYRATDLQKLGETRAMPSLSHIFETLKHLNDYLIANSKNAQLLAQLVFFFERDENATGERTFGGNQINVAGISDTVEPEGTASDSDTAIAANKIERQLEGNGIVGDLPKGVKAKLLNPQAQANQSEYLDSTLKTIFASVGVPYEVMLSTYGSNYSASMGARSDFQHNLDILTEIIPSNQLYKMHYKLFLYLQVLKGDVECKPLLNAYRKNDIITIEAISNSIFEGTKLKPIDPVKFIKSLREQLPESIREKVPLNTVEKLINAASSGDFEGVINQIANETDILKSKGLFKEDEPTE
jgi:capsid protein